MSNLLPCPFCGGEALEGKLFGEVWCRNCKVRATTADTWNARAEQPIVRCKDCLCAVELLDGTLDCRGYLAETWDYYNDEPQQNIVTPDGFCAWGVRTERSE